MSFYNGILNHHEYIHGQGQIGPRGLPGPKGDGFKLNSNGNYDMENKKLVNVKQGTNNDDVVTKSQLDSEIAKIPSVDTTQFVKKTGATMNGDLILQSQPYPVQGNTNKAISYNTASAIFLNKKEGGSMEMTLDMNNQFITNIKDPVNADHGVNKKYVDNSVKNKADLSKTTTQTFQGRIQVPDFDPSSHSGSDIVNLKDINDTFLNKNKGGVMKNPITFLSSLLNNQKQINNLGTPRYNSSAANKSYVDETLAQSHIDSSNKKNALKYLLDADESSSENNIVVLGISDFAQSPHKNKLAYKVGLQKNPKSNDYQSRIGFNLYPLSIGKFTSVLEYYPQGPHTNIQLSAQATTAYIHKTIQRASQIT